MPYQTQQQRRTGTRRQKLHTGFILVLAAVVFLAALPLMSYMAGNGNILSRLTVEAGESLPSASAFVKKDKGIPVAYASDVSCVDMGAPGDYPVSLRYGEKTVEAVIRVKDTVCPQGSARNQTTAVGQRLEAADFITDIADATKVTVTYKKEPDFSREGEQAVTLVLTDAAGNQTELTAAFTAIEDSQPPEIQGVKDIFTYAGDAVSYRSGVTVTDDIDRDPVLSVDSSNVDLSTPGVYTLVYTAADAAGNTARQETTVTVNEKKEGYAPVEDIYAAADAVLEGLLHDGMTTREQVEAIYAWARSSFGYSGHSDKSDWMQGAYVMLRDRQGDCFNYFAVTKLMFERLGIPNIDVVKVKNYEGDSQHFWSLVSVDGGKTYYHFDSTPRVGDGDDFCLVTDAFLDAYSNANNKSHNRDKSLYPATPEA